MPKGTITQAETPDLNTEYFFAPVTGLGTYLLKLDLKNLEAGDAIIVGPRSQVIDSGVKEYTSKRRISFTADLMGDHRSKVIKFSPDLVPLDFDADFGIQWISAGSGGIKSIDYQFINTRDGE